MDNQQNQPAPEQPSSQQAPPPSQQFFQPSSPPQSMSQPPVPPVAPPPAPPKKSKAQLVLLILVLVLFAAGAAYYFLFMNKSKDSGSSANNTGQATSQSAQDEAAVTKDIIFTSAVRKASVSLIIPSSWKLETENQPIDDEEGLVLVKDTYTTAKGNVLILETFYGKGGSCDPDTVKFTLVKKIPTQTTHAEFREYDYDTEDTSYDRMRGLSLEVLDNSPAAIQNMQEGESATDVCTNTAGYNAYEDLGVTIYSAADLAASREYYQPKYADLADDTELLAALASMKFTKAE